MSKQNGSNRLKTDIAPPLPSSMDAEKAVLGAILIDNKTIDEVSFLKEKDFFSEQNRKIFRLMSVMSQNGEAIDVITLPERLYSMGQLDDVGGIVYVTQMQRAIPGASNIAHYANIVRQKSIMRQAVGICDITQQMAFESSSDVAEGIVDQALQSFSDLAAEYSARRLRGKTARESDLSLLQTFGGTKNALRVNTGIEELDKNVGGFRAGELITLTAGVTGSGKTLFAQQVKRHACKNGLHGLYFSGEMPAEQLASRELATEAGVPHWKMRRYEFLTPEEFSRLVETAGNDCDVCRTIDGEFSIRDIRIASRSMKRASGLSWIVIDYDELVDAPGKDEFAQQRIVTRESKRLALSLEVPVFIISGLRKSMDKNDAKKPTLDRIYGNAAKSKHSSFVLFLDREYMRELKGDETKARICILKARDGRVGEIPATFDLTTLRFRAETSEEKFLRGKKKTTMEKAVAEHQQPQEEEMF